MAKEKFFHLHRKSDATDHLVRALKEGDAIAAVAGNQWTTRVASKGDITAHFLAGCTLHQDSIPEGPGARFIYLVPKDGDTQHSVLIRAKNTGAAVAKLIGEDLSCKVADDETLVRLLDAGVPVQDVVLQPPLVAPTSSNGGDSTGSNAAGSAAANESGDAAAAAA